MKLPVIVSTCFFCFLSFVADCQKKDLRSGGNTNGMVKIVFHNVITDTALTLNDRVYTNPWRESFVISKCKYYISHISIGYKGKKITEKNGYHLLDQAAESSLAFSFAAPENDYESIGFLIGVDSARNTSGAQTGALDPLHDMFWTWNSGYVMEKLEGTSPQSKVVNNKIEYHIGGFSGENSTLKYITLSMPPGKFLKIKKGKKSVVIINADINKFWQGDTSIKITDTPVCNSPGVLAKQIADNFCRIFNVAAVINSE